MRLRKGGTGGVDTARLEQQLSVRALRFRAAQLLRRLAGKRERQRQAARSMRVICTLEQVGSGTLRRVG